jgi:hypothetical protein
MESQSLPCFIILMAHYCNSAHHETGQFLYFRWKLRWASPG